MTCPKLVQTSTVYFFMIIVSIKVGSTFINEIKMISLVINGVLILRFNFIS